MTTETMDIQGNNSGKILRILADDYEQAQLARIRSGEQIRAVIQGRDLSWAGSESWVGKDAAAVMKEIQGGETFGPVPVLGRTYRKKVMEEKELQREMMLTLQAHPAWPWLQKVRGIGPTLACKLLAHLDPHLAPYPSSFWAYCGLSTIPGDQYQCPTCKKSRNFPTTFKVTGKHAALGSTKRCLDLMVKIAGPEDGIRVAQPKPSRGEKSSYDKYAKKLLYLVGTSFLKAKGPYEGYYREKKALLERERPGWDKGRIHLTALRKVEKLFLSHLWETWRKALGLETPTPYALGVLGHEGLIAPEEMV